MKTQFTFAEVGKIFQSIARIEEKFQKLEKAEKLHEEISEKFDAEFKKLGYTFAGASQEVYDLFDAKCNAMDAEERAEKNCLAEVKKFVEMIGIGEGYDDIVADEIKGYCKNIFYYSKERVVRDVKYMAKRAAERIEY